jgi:hypothetical protein
MISFTELGRLGRLGNQLFQYAVLKSVGIKNNYDVKIPDPSTMHWQGQDCLLDQFNLECDYLTPSDYAQITRRVIEEDVSEFYPDIFSISDNIDLYGFFQNYQYFKDYEKQIKKEFELCDNIKDTAKDCLQSIIDDANSDAKIVSIHMRRGDNTDGTNPAYSNFYGEGDILTPDSYYGKYFFKALEAFKDKNVKYLVFSGGSRTIGSSNLSDIEWCKKNFNGENVYYAENNKDLVDFSLMSMCHHNITCHMTSFGWWAALLNKNPDKIVIAPKGYSVPDDGRVHNGFYPPSWRII